MLFSKLCVGYFVFFFFFLDTSVHHISNESEDMLLLKPICNYNFMQLCFNLKNNHKFSWINWRAADSGFSSHGENTLASRSERVKIWRKSVCMKL